MVCVCKTLCSHLPEACGSLLNRVCVHSHTSRTVNHVHAEVLRCSCSPIQAEISFCAICSQISLHVKEVPCHTSLKAGADGGESQCQWRRIVGEQCLVFSPLKVLSLLHTSRFFSLIYLWWCILLRPGISVLRAPLIFIHYLLCEIIVFLWRQFKQPHLWTPCFLSVSKEGR